jgi:hypothetical protein
MGLGQSQIRLLGRTCVMYLLPCQGDLQVWLVIDNCLRDLVCPINDDTALFVGGGFCLGSIKCIPSGLGGDG